MAFEGNSGSNEVAPLIPNAASMSFPSQKKDNVVVDVDVRQVSRTPSPSPSEIEALSTNRMFDVKKLLTNWKYVVPLIIILILTIVFFIFNKQIIHALEPGATKLRDLPGGWVIPIVILVIISFPPLFGHEIIAMLAGLVWPLWEAFAIVAAGTLLGEIANFYAFKYMCRARGEKLEKTNIQYMCLARVVRTGGFWIALVIRFSAIPGHFTTAVFSVTGMNILVFIGAATLSLPKQLATVYIGDVLKEDGEDSSSANEKNKWISLIVVVVTTIVTNVALWYIRKKINEVKPDVIYQRRKARQAKLEREGGYPVSSGNYGSDDSLHAPVPKYAPDAQYAPASQYSQHYAKATHLSQTADYTSAPRTTDAGWTNSSRAQRPDHNEYRMEPVHAPTEDPFVDHDTTYQPPTRYPPPSYNPDQWKST